MTHNFMRIGRFVDTEDNGPYTATVDYGDGGPVEALPLSPDGTYILFRQYETPGNRTIGVAISDSRGGVGRSFFPANTRAIMVVDAPFSIPLITMPPSPMSAEPEPVAHPEDVRRKLLRRALFGVCRPAIRCPFRRKRNLLEALHDSRRRS